MGWCRSHGTLFGYGVTSARVNGSGLADTREGCGWLGPMDKSEGLEGRAGPGRVVESEKFERAGLAWSLLHPQYC